MKVLLLGGTGAMGVPLGKILAEKGHDVYVTTRRTHSDNEGINYITGDAKEDIFFEETLDRGWDVVIDFMAYSTAAFKKRLALLLYATKQYVFLSSARVYSQSDFPITEETPRLLDVLDDKEYLSTDEYGLSKARQENLLRDSGRKNWTVIRPSVTFSEARLQLGVLEKESWLYRALNGRSIVFSDDISAKLTAMTHGLDVAHGIASIVGNSKAYGEVFHITSEEALKWQEILEIYLSVLEEKLGSRPKVVMTDRSLNLNFNKYQVIYSRYYNRRFDNKKIKQFIDVNKFIEIRKGLRTSLEEFLGEPSFKDINWVLEAMHDRAAKEFTPLSEIPTGRLKLYYLAKRFRFSFILVFLKKVRNIFN